MIGGAYGGGVEMILNCDLVIASQDAKFALPEVRRGVVAAQGGKYLVVFQLNYVAIFLNLRFLISHSIFFFLLVIFLIGIPRLSQIAGHQVNIHFIMV